MFTPESGTIELEFFRDQPTLCILVQCAEAMDPEGDRENDDRTKIRIDGIPFAGASHRDLSSVRFSETEITTNEILEGSIYHCGYHNPIDFRMIRVVEIHKGAVLLDAQGTIDFTYEGLARLGKPTLQMRLSLACDFDRFDEMCSNGP